jgi:hypothetical protein
MKKVSLFVFITIIGLFLIFPCFSIAQKKPTPAKKPTEVVASKSLTAWQTLKVEECGFSAEMPGKFEKVSLDLGGRVMTVWKFNTSNNAADNTAQYSISCYPLFDAEVQNPLTFLSREMESVLDGTVISKKSISLSGNTGVEWIHLQPNNWLEQTKLYAIVSNRIAVEITMVTRDDKTFDETKSNRTRFFNSLKLL